MNLSLAKLIFTEININNDNSNLNLGWLLDFRNLVGDKSQVYSINGTSAAYKQDNALTREISLVANLGLSLIHI